MITPQTDTALTAIRNEIDRHECTEETHDHKPLNVWIGELTARIAEVSFSVGDDNAVRHMLVEIAAIAVMAIESTDRFHDRVHGTPYPWHCPECGVGFYDNREYDAHREQFKVRA